MSTVKLPKDYFTVSELATEWNCSEEAIEWMLYKRGNLSSIPEGAALNGKRDIQVVACRYLDKDTLPCLAEQYPDSHVEIAAIEPGETESEAEARVWRLLDDDGELERVITNEEAGRFRRENPDYISSAAAKRGPKKGPREDTLYRVLAALALKKGYNQDGKNPQGWTSELVRLSRKDPGCINSAIDTAIAYLHSVYPESKNVK